MERTIDGIDYIAKSEVLRIIDEDMKHARIYVKDKKMNADQRYGWSCRHTALSDLRKRLTNSKER